jgi:hypothetical protein
MLAASRGNKNYKYDEEAFHQQPLPTGVVYEKARYAPRRTRRNTKQKTYEFTPI